MRKLQENNETVHDAELQQQEHNKSLRARQDGSHGGRAIFCFRQTLKSLLEICPSIQYIHPPCIIINKFIYIFSSLTELLSDQDSNIFGELMKEVARIFRIKQIKTSAYHPQSRISKTFTSCIS